VAKPPPPEVENFLAIMRFTLTVYASDVAGSHCSYPQRDGQAQ